MTGDRPDSRSRLFSPGERLGWEFRDRVRQWRHFHEAEPRPVVADPGLRARLDRLIARRRSALTWAIPAAAAAGLAAWYLVTGLGPGDRRPAALTVAAVAALLAALWLSLWRPLRLARLERRARHALGGLETTARARHDEASTTWHARAREHTVAEWSRVNEIPEWGAVRGAIGTSRIDVFGGSLRSWEGLLTTFGASMVATAPPVRVLDLSEGMVAQELCQLTADGGLTVSAQVLPRQLASSDLLAGLDAGELTDVLVESIHGDRSHDHREARAMDTRILGAVCRALEPALSLARVHEALLAAMREPGRPERLSPEERDTIGTRLFSAEYVERGHERFRSLEAHLHPLRELGSRDVGQRPAGARLQCLAVGGDGQVFATDLFVDLAAQWAIRGLRGDAEPGAAPGTVIVAGADRLRRRHLERLADACERRGVRLLYLFRHLRDDAEHLLGGGGAAAFMRLGNHREAERAAHFIGRGHRFVLSQVTRGHGAKQTHTAGETEGESEGRHTEPGSLGLFPARSRTRSWGDTRSYAEGANWHYAESAQRVYEYVVEPTALQNLPDYALLVVQPGQVVEPASDQLTGRSRVLVADCNPDIVSLPRVLTEPFADRAAAIEPVRATPIERAAQDRDQDPADHA
jgi:hypothetical protein